MSESAEGSKAYTTHLACSESDSTTLVYENVYTSGDGRPRTSASALKLKCLAETTLKTGLGFCCHEVIHHLRDLQTQVRCDLAMPSGFSEKCSFETSKFQPEVTGNTVFLW